MHPGLIVRVRDFGLFVELQDCHVEGLVHVKDMADDFYDYQENQHTLRGRRTRRAFRLGDKVSVHILRIDLGKKEVSLAIAD
ncbi:MAG: S1 RNA-binding domain-containing protein [Planctomycetota bacterium]